MLDKQIKRPDQFITAADINMYRNKEEKESEQLAEFFILYDMED